MLGGLCCWPGRRGRFYPVNHPPQREMKAQSMLIDGGTPELDAPGQRETTMQLPATDLGCVDKLLPCGDYDAPG